MTSGPPSRGALWPLERHTAAKHAILERYFAAWFPIMGRSNSRILVIDAFAGPGQYANGERGSPLLLLETAATHTALPALRRCETVFLFLEPDPARFVHLTSLISRRDWPTQFTIRPLNAPFDTTASVVLDRLEAQGLELAPALLLLDPFGFSQTPFDLVRRLARYPKSEVLISFMAESINRFLGKPELARTFDTLFGTPSWRDLPPNATPRERWDALQRLYVGQLEEVGLQTRSFAMRDSGGRVEYYLIYGTHSSRGLSVMKDAMWKVDPSGSFTFSDETNPAQLVLIEPQPDLTGLANLLESNFRGSIVAIDEVEEFVVVDKASAFRQAHTRAALKLLEERMAIAVNRGAARKGSFPPGTSITFL